jgi:methyl-accepting chemotaxis protein
VPAGERSGEEIVTNPVKLSNGGKDVILISMVVPVRSRGVRLGVCAADLLLDDVQERFGPIEPRGKGSYESLVSFDGEHVTHPDAKEVNHDIGQKEEHQRIKSAIAQGQPISLTRASNTLKGALVYTGVAPITNGKTRTHWGYMANIPISAIDALAVYLRNIVILLGVLSVASVVVAVYWLNHRLVTHPLKATFGMLNELARGHLSVRAGFQRSDEIGDLAQTMDRLASDLQSTVIKVVDGLAEGNLDAEIVPRDERDEIKPPLRRIVQTLKELVPELVAWQWATPQ